MKTGDIVAFKTKMYGEDSFARFVVLEDRGGRVLVGSVDEYWKHQTIKPTFVYLKTDLLVCAPKYHTA